MCDKSVKTTESYSSKTNCGFWGWATCYKKLYRTKYKTVCRQCNSKIPVAPREHSAKHSQIGLHEPKRAI
jgi:hypothetical protein